MLQSIRFTILLCFVILTACKQPGKTATELADESIVSSNELIDYYNKSIYNAFSDKLHNIVTKSRADIWAPKADAIRQQSRQARFYTDSLRIQLSKGVTLNDAARMLLFHQLLESKEIVYKRCTPKNFRTTHTCSNMY